MSDVQKAFDLSESAADLQVRLRYSNPVTIPEKSLADWGIALMLFVATCLYLRLSYNHLYLDFDEGFGLQGAQRILHGEVLYRDFFSFYTPGSYYWLALLFKLFGTSILVVRGALVVYGGVFSVLTYFIARRVCSRFNSVLATLPAVLVGLTGWFLVIPCWDTSGRSSRLILQCGFWKAATGRGHWCRAHSRRLRVLLSSRRGEAYCWAFALVSFFS